MSVFHERAASYYRSAKGAKRKAAEFILLHSDEVAFMTLEQISEQIGVSPATITRTATEMGYRGYPGLLQAARSEVRRDMAPIEKLDYTVPHEGSLGFYESLAVDRLNPETLAQMNSAETIRSSVKLLSEASRVRLFSSRTSYGALSFFAYALGQIRPDTALLTEAEGRLTDELIDIAPGDVFFLADLPRYSKVVIACAREAQYAGAKVICVTDSPSSPTNTFTDIPLFVPYTSHSFFNSNIASLSLYNALATAINLNMKNISLPRLQRHNELLQRFGVLEMQKKAHE